MSFYLKGVHVPHRKNTAGMSPKRMEQVGSVAIPMSMHIGAPAVPCVKVGDEVKVGTLIAEAGGYVSAPIYSSVSGKVTKLDRQVNSAGGTNEIIIIESDGKMEIDESIAPPAVSSKEDFINAIKASGIVGLGGAGFPTYVKLNVGEDKTADTLVINGAECEPYITSDSVTMTERADDIAFGIEQIKKYLGIQKVIIGIESNKKTAIHSMKAMAKDMAGVEVKVLPAVYPQGGEKVLVYHTTGRVIKLGRLPLDVGCIVCNCTTVAEIGKYIKTGMPLTERCITVDGSAVKNPQNVIAPIGTAIADVFEFCGGFKEEPDKVIYGGPMMGVAVASMTDTVRKNTNALLAFDAAQAKLKEPTSCIRCGACINQCPFGINPAGISGALNQDDCEAMEKCGADLCMECGCCSFVCPANRPLVQNNKLAKAALKKWRAEKKDEEGNK